MQIKINHGMSFLLAQSVTFFLILCPFDFLYANSPVVSMAGCSVLPVTRSGHQGSYKSHQSIAYSPNNMKF